MDEAMEGTGKKVKLKTKCERQQRCLVNQRFAAYVLTLLDINTTGGVMCLVAWALHFANNSRTDWMRHVGGEIACWLFIPAIILGLFFDAELGNYFDQSYAWMNRTGPFHNRCGFRMLEIHDFFWDFEMPWWNKAVSHPELCMPRTWAYLHNNFEGEEFERRKQQVMRGLRAGRDEILKIAGRYLLNPPILLLLLTNCKHGPDFLRATLSVLHEYAHRVPGVELIRDPGDGYGTYIYTTPNERPPD